MCLLNLKIFNGQYNNQSIPASLFLIPPPPSPSGLFSLLAHLCEWVNVIIDCLFLLLHFIPPSRVFWFFNRKIIFAPPTLIFVEKSNSKFLIDSPFWWHNQFWTSPSFCATLFCETNSTHILMHSILGYLNQKCITGFCTCFAAL